MSEQAKPAYEPSTGARRAFRVFAITWLFAVWRGPFRGLGELPKVFSNQAESAVFLTIAGFPLALGVMLLWDYVVKVRVERKTKSREASTRNETAKPQSMVHVDRGERGR